MAFYLKVLEKGSNDTVDGLSHFANQYGSESTGYTGTNCTVSLDSTNHIWTMTGNAATTNMIWSYATTTAYAASKIVFFRAKVTITKVGATMTNIKLRCRGSTSGTQDIKVQTNPAVGTTYDLYARATLSGLVGNLIWDVYVDDDVTTNTVTATISHWVAIDLTTEQGAGKESAEADIYAWMVQLFGDWTWLDWYYYAAGQNRYYRLEYAPAHGMLTGDVRQDVSQTFPTFYSVWGAVTKLDANWYSVQSSAATGNLGNTICPFKQTDRTSRLLSGSLRLNLRSDIEAEITCDMLGDSTWQPLAGMTVLLFSDSELLHTGKITSVTRSNYATNAKWRCSVRIGTLSESVGRCFYNVSDAFDGLSSGAAVEQIRMGSLNYQGGMAIQRGRIDTGQADIGEFDQNGRNAAEMLNDLATAAGYVWYVDKYRRLHFRTPLVTPADAAHALVDGNGFTDYSNVEYTQTTDSYRTRQIVTGDYADDGTPVISVRTLDDLSVTYPISTDTEASWNGYTAIARNNTLDNTTDAATSADSNLKRYGAQVPCTISFESGQTDWRPNTKLTVQLANLGISSSVYFNIDSVEIFDADGRDLRCRVTGSQRDPSFFASVPNSGPTEYLSNLQTMAQNSNDAIKQEAGTWTPTLMGAGTAGTWTYTSQIGHYLRYGSMVWFDCRVVPASISGSPTGNLQIMGLPFASLTGTRAIAPCMTTGVNWGTSMTQVVAHIPSAAQYILLYGNINNASFAAIPVGNVSASDDIYVCGCYQITPP